MQAPSASPAMRSARDRWTDGPAVRRWATLLVGAGLVASLGLLGGCTSAGTTVRTVDVPSGPAEPDADLDRRTRVRLELASAYFAQGQTATALDEVQQVLRFNPSSAAAYNLRALIFARQNDEVQADASFRQALQLAPKDGDTLHNYGWYQCQRRRYDEAQQLFSQALESSGYRGQVRTLLTQGVCRARAGQWPEAERALNQAFELDPANPAVSVNLAEVLYRRNELERARFYIKRVNAQPEQSNAETLWLAARIERRAQNAGALRELGQQLVARFPQSREAAAYERGAFDD